MFASLLVAPTYNLALAAEWMKIQHSVISTRKAAAFYADVASISRVGNDARMWTKFVLKSPELVNLQKPQNGSYLSGTMLHQYLCTERMTSLLDVRLFRDANTEEPVSDKLVGALDRSLQHVAPESAEDAAIKIACK